jgi:hypothetical protein
LAGQASGPPALAIGADKHNKAAATQANWILDTLRPPHVL